MRLTEITLLGCTGPFNKFDNYPQLLLPKDMLVKILSKIYNFKHLHRLTGAEFYEIPCPWEGENEEHAPFSVDVPSSTDPTSHVTLFVAERTAEESKTKKQGRLQRSRLSKLKIKQHQKSEEREGNWQNTRKSNQRIKETEPEEGEQRERRLEDRRARYKRNRETETPEKRKIRLEKARFRMSQRTTRETLDQREKRLERQRAWNRRNIQTETGRKKRTDMTETEAQRESRLEDQRLRKRQRKKRRKQKLNVKADWKISVYGTGEEERRKQKRNNSVKEDWKVAVHAGQNPELLKLKKRACKDSKKNVKKSNEDVVPVEPTVAVKEEPIQSDPEPLASLDIGIEDIGDAVPVIIKEQPISFDPGSSADIVIKDEFVVYSENDTSADVPPATVPTSHVTLSVACLGSGQKPDSDQ
ncbi:hypothetical protein CDAR_394511 [Caerostris darwini]|uniref:Uncharacterized protein n=1 Tax=Caerostris darwini TaxID=1538125 RepID=A0AAV4U194_9ARAC|nr:hypothetical protein CDAR_394511 [Caerostris darwini]